MSGQRAASELRGRSEERRALDRLLDGARAGQSSVLVMRGEPGVGKSALLEYTAERASGFRVARARGVESEMEFAFAGLQQLCGGSPLAAAERLAAPQRDALLRAYGLMDGPPPEAFLVGLAILNVLTNLAEEQPLVCLIDDVQWLDRGSVSGLSFVARRLSAEPIAVIFSVRAPNDEPDLEGLPELLLAGLAPSDARALLETALPGGLDEQVRERILAETRGNPLALLELPHGLTPAELAGGFGLLEAGELSSRIEQSFVRRVQALPSETQRLLLVAAAEDIGDAAVVARAAARLGVQADAVVPAEDGGLAEGGPRFRFRHPLVRAASYRAATLHERRQAHEALAAETDPEQDPDRRAWHLAHAASGPDEDVADELERSASRACSRGGIAAGAAFLEQAAELTPDPVRRGARALAAARLKFQVGAPDAAERLLAVATATPLGELELARADRLRALMVFVGTGSRAAAPLLSAAATRMEPHDPELARETHLEALWAAVRSGRFVRPEGIVDAAAAAVAARAESTRAVDLLLAGAVARMSEGHEPSQTAVRRAIAAFRAEGFSRESLASDELVGPRGWLACQLALDLWDHDGWNEIASGLIRFAREQGRLAILPIALYYTASYRLLVGELGVAGEMLREAEAIASVTRGLPTAASVSAVHAAWCGDRERTEALRAATIATGTARGEGFAIEVGECAAAVLHNGLGDYAEAAAAGQRGP